MQNFKNAYYKNAYADTKTNEQRDDIRYNYNKTDQKYSNLKT